MVHTASNANVSARIIAFSGAPGTGKTEAVFKLTHRMKMDGKRVKPLITYFKRRADSGLTYRDTIANGFCEQVNAELSVLARNFDFIITNHTVVDWVTTALTAGNLALYSAMAPMAMAHLAHYRTISISPIENAKSRDYGGISPAVAELYQHALVETYKHMGIVMDAGGRASLKDLAAEFRNPDPFVDLDRSCYAKILEGFQTATIN